jgi:hypothetical protein
MCGAAPVTRASCKSHTVGFRYAANKPARVAITGFADNSRHSSVWAGDRCRRARERGARHPHAVRIVVRGWIRVIWACWSTDTIYDPSRPTGWLCRWRSAHRVDRSDTRTSPTGLRRSAGQTRRTERHHRSHWRSRWSATGNSASFSNTQGPIRTAHCASFAARVACVRCRQHGPRHERQLGWLYRGVTSSAHGRLGVIPIRAARVRRSRHGDFMVCARGTALPAARSRTRPNAFITARAACTRCACCASVGVSRSPALDLGFVTNVNEGARSGAVWLWQTVDAKT